MSSTLSFARAKLPYLNELGELLGTEVWLKHDKILYSEHESTRGVAISHADGRMTLRLLACASPYDYALAYKLAGALSEGPTVDVEGAGELPAQELAARLVDWELRDRATALAALRASVAQGTVVVDGVKHRIELTRPEDVDTLEARLRAPEYSPRSLAIVLRDGVARAYMGHQVIRLLADDPTTTLAAVEATLRPSTPADYHLDNGFLIDVDAKRLLGFVSEVPHWPGWTCTVEQPEAFAIYLGARGLGIPMLYVPDDDPAVDAVVAPLALGLHERTRWLAAENAKLPPPRKRRAMGVWLLLLGTLICLPLRLLALPFRRRIQESHRQAAIAYRDDRRARFATLAGATTNTERIDRALFLESFGYRDEAERELSACLDAEPARALIRYDLGVVRRFSYPALGQRDIDEAIAQGYTPPKPVRDWRGLFWLFLGL